jgi:hypothetical protein
MVLGEDEASAFMGRMSIGRSSAVPGGLQDPRHAEPYDDRGSDSSTPLGDTATINYDLWITQIHDSRGEMMAVYGQSKLELYFSLPPPYLTRSCRHFRPTSSQVRVKNTA